MPTLRHIRSRRFSFPRSGTVVHTMARFASPARVLPSLSSDASYSGALPSVASTSLRENTSVSSSELLASRLAPWTAAQAASPQAYRPSTLVRPHVSIRMPPIM